jgi:hypothetical protein
MKKEVQQTYISRQFTFHPFKAIKSKERMKEIIQFYCKSDFTTTTTTKTIKNQKY